MRVGMMLNYSGGFTETVSELSDFEKAGLQVVFVPEAYSFDAVSQLGFIAARTSTVEIASGILPIYSRSPALTAMTAAGLDFVSGGRFTLGLGTSGPQVIEGWHGVPYDAPVGRTRELIEICRMVWRRERLDYHGPEFGWWDMTDQYVLAKMNALEVDRMMIDVQRAGSLPVAENGVPLAGSLIPWIAEDMGDGRLIEPQRVLGLARGAGRAQQCHPVSGRIDDDDTGATRGDAGGHQDPVRRGAVGHADLDSRDGA